MIRTLLARWALSQLAARWRRRPPARTPAADLEAQHRRDLEAQLDRDPALSGYDPAVQGLLRDREGRR